MLLKVPGQDISLRLFERVETVNDTYDIFDIGVQQADKSIDSIVVGGNFSYAKSLLEAMDKKAEEKKADKPAVTVVATAA